MIISNWKKQSAFHTGCFVGTVQYTIAHIQAGGSPRKDFSDSPPLVQTWRDRVDIIMAWVKRQGNVSRGATIIILNTVQYSNNTPGQGIRAWILHKRRAGGVAVVMYVVFVLLPRAGLLLLRRDQGSLYTAVRIRTGKNATSVRLRAVAAACMSHSATISLIVRFLCPLSSVLCSVFCVLCSLFSVRSRIRRTSYEAPRTQPGGGQVVD